MTEFERLVSQSRKMSRRLGGLTAILLAVGIDDAESVEWDSTNARFRVNNTEVSLTEIQTELERIDLRISRTVTDHNNKLWNKEWTVTKWRVEMEKLVEGNHLIFGALALGGLLVAAKDATVKRRIVSDRRALLRYKYSLSKGLVASLPVANNRSRSYIRSFSVTYNLLSQRVHILAGYTEARRILSKAEHCRTKNGLEGCLEAAARGWMPIRQMPPIGTLPCKVWCKCKILYRRLETS